MEKAFGFYRLHVYMADVSFGSRSACALEEDSQREPRCATHVHQQLHFFD